jgi:hypothetical protein
LDLAPCEESFDVFGGDVAGIRFGGGVFGEEIQDVVVLLPGELFAEGLDVLQEALNGFGEGKLGFGFVGGF